MQWQPAAAGDVARGLPSAILHGRVGEGCPVSGVETRCMLNVDVGLSVRFPRVTPASGWNPEDRGDDG